MSAKKKGVCPVCGDAVGVRLDGMIRSHGYLKGVGDKLACAGTGQEPREGVDGAFSALCMAADCNLQTAAIVWAEHSWLSLCRSDAVKVLT